MFIRHVIRTLIRVGAAGFETLLFSLWGGKYVTPIGKVTPLLPNALCLFHSIVHELFFADHKFASAGREDVDVRMLGNGMLAPHVFSS